MKASIDIGTNTVLLLVAEHSGEALQVLHEEQRIPRLGKGVDKAGNLEEGAAERVIQALREYQQVIREKYPPVEEIRVTATSAVRDAGNRARFVSRVKEQTGLEVRVLSGREEARYTFLGAQSVLNGQGDLPTVIIDIGGGSTEIAIGSGKKLEDRYSFDMGCVRFTERYLKQDPPAEQQVQACREAIEGTLKEYDFQIPPEAEAVGVAGTVTSLAFIDRELDRFEADKLNGCSISRKRLNHYVEKYREWPSVRLKEEYPMVMEGRADIFLAGLLILQGIMNRYAMDRLTVSTGGIRHGAILASN